MASVPGQVPCCATRPAIDVFPAPPPSLRPLEAARGNAAARQDHLGRIESKTMQSRNDPPSDRLIEIEERLTMCNDAQPPPFNYEGMDPVPEPKSTIAEISDAMKVAVDFVQGAIDAGRRPGMPLSILSNMAREAPLGSLFVAFMLGIAVGRRR